MPLTPTKLNEPNQILEYAPEDMTVTVEAGVPLAKLQAELACRGQWLPVDPPNPETLSVGALLDTNVSGPRRFGYGTIREHLIGIKVALADGRVIKAGGKVVKNVAGYDLCKLFVGSHGTLGIITEASFKLLPLPETEMFVQARFDSLREAEGHLEAVLSSPLTPAVLDLHNLSTLNSSTSQLSLSLVLGFAGTREAVEWQLAQARELGIAEPATLDHEKAFRAGQTARAHSQSVLPSKLIPALEALLPAEPSGPIPFVARAGNGIIYHRGGPAPKQELPLALLQRIKEAFDPNRTFPDFET
jgi:FAD/FMN-containing dehydrogenase